MAIEIGAFGPKRVVLVWLLWVAEMAEMEKMEFVLEARQITIDALGLEI